MSDQPDHLDSKEATEAKLCAYLEGELPPSDRAEIEQHLAANPQHRKLLADMAQTREWMRALPRESAPSDLAESFQGQVERNMLLDDSGDIGSGMSIVRWPQFAMIAAILVLTLGLGVTLVIMLKGPNASHNFSMGTSTVTPPTLPAVVASKTAEETKNPVVVAAIPAAPAVTPAPIAAAAAPQSVVADAMTEDRTANRRMVLAPALADKDKDAGADEIKTKLAASGYRVPGDARTVCFLVRSDVPAATNDQVHGFFTRHQLLLEEPASLTPAHAQNTMTITENVEAKGGRGGGRNLADQSQMKQQGSLNSGSVNNGSLNNATLNSGSTNAAAPAQNQTSPATGSGFGGGGGSGGGSNNSNGTNNLQQADTVQAGNSLKGANTFQGTGAPGGTASSQYAMQADGAPVGDQLYVAHGLTPLQLELLGASLATDNQTVKRLTLSEGIVVEKELQTPPGTIAKGQTLTVTIPQLVGPGIEKANIVKVSEDGTINLPMIDPVPAAGSTADDLKQKIAAKYRDANLIPDASVTVAVPPSTQPATMPATQPMGLAKAADTTTQPTDAPVAATQPVHDEGIDVVVVIEKSDGADKAK